MSWTINRVLQLVLLFVLVLFITRLNANDDASSSISPDSWLSSLVSEGLMDDDVLEISPSPVVASVEPPSNCDNAELIERTRLLEQALKQTLEALSVKLGHQPFGDIINSLQGQTESSRRRADKVVIPEIISSDSSVSNSTSSTQDASQENGNVLASHNYVKNEVEHLKGVMKCSLLHKSEFNQSSGLIKATTASEGLLKVHWSLPSDECHDYNTGAWLEVTDTHDGSSLTSQFIPEDCQTRNESSLSITVQTKNNASDSISQNQQPPCQIIIPRELEECKVYSVQIVPEYDSVRGQLQSTDVIIPPKMEENGSPSESYYISESWDSLQLSLTVQSTSCARQMTSVFVRIYPDGIETALPLAMQIPRPCFKKVEESGRTAFSMTLSTDTISSCQAITDWKPLQQCRQYRVVLQVEYSSKWKSLPFVWDNFITSVSKDNTLSAFWEQLALKRSKKPFRHNEKCNPRNNNVYGGYLALTESLICNGYRDCSDGTDEANCGFQESCQALTTAGRFLEPAKIPAERSESSVMTTFNSAFFIATKPGHIIWLNFKLLQSQTASIQIYDGAYPSASKLVLNHTSSDNKPLIGKSVRSSSNHLYVVYSIYSSSNPASQFAFMTVEDSMSPPYVAGCGGYMIDEGIITSNPPKETDRFESQRKGISSCEWFIESSGTDSTIILKEIMNPQPRYSFPRVVKVFEGWNRSSEVKYQTPPQKSQTIGAVRLNSIKSEVYSIVYSTKNKVRILIESDASQTQQLWNVTKISTPQYHFNLTGLAGAIKTPNYPLVPYPNMADCRWSIKVDEGSKIRIVFASFQSEDKHDFVYVYDGPTFDSPLLLAKSGENVEVPFTVNSTSNHMLVRFTSDEKTNAAGFIAVFSSF